MILSARKSADRIRLTALPKPFSIYDWRYDLRGHCNPAARKSYILNRKGFGRAVSRILSTLLRAERIICLSSRYPESSRVGGIGAGRSGIPYLALHPMGFSVPRRLRFARCALTAPFHPYHIPCEMWRFNFLWHCPSETFISARVYHCLATVLDRRYKVTRHRALWCSDFPPPARAEGDPPPFQNHNENSRPP